MKTSNEEEEISALLMNMLAAWNRGDAKSFDSAFSEDIDLVDTVGQRFKGRDQIASVHSEELQGQLKGSQMELEEMTVRLLRDDIAIVHLDTNIQPGGRRAIMTALAIKSDGEWHISAAQNSVKRY